MSPANPRTLDHLIHLSPPGELSSTVEHFTSLGLTVLPGGTHADGLTSNALIVLPDGIYIELIQFVHPLSHYPEGSDERAKREGHWWAAKREGWIDWALLGSKEQEEGVESFYDPPQEGGRKRPDREEVRWKVTFPGERYERGSVPFYCEDLTPRALRVPPSPTAHPNKATSIASLTLLLSRTALAPTTLLYTSILGAGPVRSTAHESVYVLDAPEKAGGVELVLRLPQGVEEEKFVMELGGGVWEVGVRLGEGEEGEAISGGQDGVGRVRFVGA